jgi:hypothetical protein
MIFSDKKLIESMNESPVSAIIDAINIAEKLMDIGNLKKWSASEQDILMETITMIEVLIESNGFDSRILKIELSGDVVRDCQQMFKYTQEIKNKFIVESRELKAKLKIETYKNHYKSVLKSSFAYEFSQGDIDRIQILVNELREHITGMDNLSDDHKTRLLKRLEKLQSELHKRLSDLDKFWGIVGDAGVVLGKFGDDAKPIVDRIREISEIVWHTQTLAEGLPSNSPYPLLNDEKDT